MSDEIATRLQHLRKMYGLSQRELAKRAGVTNSSISMIEQGRVSPSFNSLEKLLSAIPITVKDFFNLDFQSDAQSFYRSFELFEGSENGVDSYSLSEGQAKGSRALIYQVYNPQTDSGENMLMDQQVSRGIVIQGELEITVNNHCQQLEPGDGFVVEPLSPYRICNNKQEKAIVVISHHHP